MRLSEAMRLGAMLRPQGYGALFDRYGNSCALGATIEALTGISFVNGISSNLYKKTYTLHQREFRKPTDCPACADADDVEAIITHLNDAHYWSRERIAAWLEPIEPTDEPAIAVVNSEPNKLRDTTEKVHGEETAELCHA